MVHLYGRKVVLNDVVSLCPDSPDEPLYIARIISMWEDSIGKKKFHGWWFWYVKMYMYNVMYYIYSVYIQTCLYKFSQEPMKNARVGGYQRETSTH